MSMIEAQHKPAMLNPMQETMHRFAILFLAGVLFLISLIFGYIGAGTFLVGINPSPSIKALTFAAVLILPFLEMAFLGFKNFSRKYYWSLIGIHLAIFVIALISIFIKEGINQAFQTLWFSGYSIFAIFSWAFNIFF